MNAKKKYYITFIMSGPKKKKKRKVLKVTQTRASRLQVLIAIPCSAATEPRRHLVIREVKFYYFNADMW